MGRAVSAFVCVNGANRGRYDCASTLHQNIERTENIFILSIHCLFCSVQSSYRFDTVVVVAVDRRLQ